MTDPRLDQALARAAERVRLQRGDKDDALSGRNLAGWAEAVRALRAEQLLTLKAPNPFGHDCEWCGKCVQRVVEMNFEALAAFGNAMLGAKDA